MTICMHLNMPLLAADDLSVQQQQVRFEEQKKEPVPEPLPETVAPFVPEYFRDRMEVRWASETRLLDGATATCAPKGG